MSEEEGILYVAVLATKLIHLPDEPAGVRQIGTQTVEVLSPEYSLLHCIRPKRPDVSYFIIHHSYFIIHH